ncbi:flavoprotein [Halobacillus sp. HZG1]|uniref:flavoprotein n=1 Tax=Halobacillus sp. HZG1 TaxID=3111769 RepID=UPI002DB6DFA7|nr:flavoprotein [Halobacillus sp. HZG1]MEC3882532.1 flavoprotein [Halobacillus sp. HZG1]
MDFQTFYEEYKRRASQQDLDYLKKVTSQALVAREIRHGERVDYSYEESMEGWHQAFEHFKDQDMYWIYTDHSVTMLNENIQLAAFWISIRLNGELLPTSNLFFDTFEKQGDEWLLVRSYIESGVQNPPI